jgi:hypothetical protein
MIDFKDICSVLNDHNTIIQSNKYLKLNKKFPRLSFTTKKVFIVITFWQNWANYIYCVKSWHRWSQKAVSQKLELLRTRKTGFGNLRWFSTMFLVPLITNCLCFPTKKMFCFFLKNDFQNFFFFDLIPKIELKQINVSIVFRIVPLRIVSLGTWWTARIAIARKICSTRFYYCSTPFEQ